MNKKSILVTTIVSLLATGCGATIVSEDTIPPPAEDTIATVQTMSQYSSVNPSLMIDITQIQDDMGAVSDATDLGSVSLVESACATLSNSATDALNDYADAPSEYMLDAFRNLVAGADACVDGEYTVASTYIKKAGTSFTLATAEINAEG